MILGIETSGRAGNVAVCEDEDVLATFGFEPGRHHARDIVSGVDEVLADAGVEKAEVEAVAVSRGPGSFTGLRIGVTCAKTLAWALGWAAVGVPSLEVLVQNVPPAGAPACACPTRDARRGRIYATIFERQDDRWTDKTGVLLLAASELAERLPAGALVFGTGARAYPAVLGGERFRVGGRELELGRAEEVARLGLRRLAAGHGDDPMQLVPLYHRQTAPEEKLARRET
jgi:tRNA threonylcarbamoyladenosine biosynthesis protein TsaB